MSIKHRLRKQRRDREKLLAKMFVRSGGELDASIDLIEIGKSAGMSGEYAFARVMELNRDGFIDGMGDGDGPSGVSVQMSNSGRRLAEQLIESPWHKIWNEHKHSIVTGAFSLIAAILGGVVGSLFTLLLHHQDK